jgi:CLIP-associating protein 1/2
LSTEKAQDVKAQVLATIKILYKKDSSAFRPHVPKGIESVLICRTAYDARAHIVSGLELLSAELVSVADPSSTISTITKQLSSTQLSSVEGSRTLSMGLHVLKALLDVKRDFTPTAEQTDKMCELAARCLESSESGVRMDAVSLCVSVHERIGEESFWRGISAESGKSVSGDSKSLILYYIVKRQREIAADGQ